MPRGRKVNLVTARVTKDTDSKHTSTSDESPPTRSLRKRPSQKNPNSALSCPVSKKAKHDTNGSRKGKSTKSPSAPATTRNLRRSLQTTRGTSAGVHTKTVSKTLQNPLEIKEILEKVLSNLRPAELRKLRIVNSNWNFFAVNELRKWNLSLKTEKREYYDKCGEFEDLAEVMKLTHLGLPYSKFVIGNEKPYKEAATGFLKKFGTQVQYLDLNVSKTKHKSLRVKQPIRNMYQFLYERQVKTFIHRINTRLMNKILGLTPNIRCLILRGVTAKCHAGTAKTEVPLNALNSLYLFLDDAEYTPKFLKPLIARAPNLTGIQTESRHSFEPTQLDGVLNTIASLKPRKLSTVLLGGRATEVSQALASIGPICRIKVLGIEHLIGDKDLFNTFLSVQANYLEILILEKYENFMPTFPIMPNLRELYLFKDGMDPDALEPLPANKHIFPNLKTLTIHEVALKALFMNGVIYTTVETLRLHKSFSRNIEKRYGDASNGYRSEYEMHIEQDTEAFETEANQLITNIDNVFPNLKTFVLETDSRKSGLQTVLSTMSNLEHLIIVVCTLDKINNWFESHKLVQSPSQRIKTLEFHFKSRVMVPSFARDSFQWVSDKVASSFFEGIKSVQRLILFNININEETITSLKKRHGYVEAGSSRGCLRHVTATLSNGLDSWKITQD